MSKKLAFALVLVGVAAACTQQPQPVVTQPVAVTTEPVYQGKYGAN